MTTETITGEEATRLFFEKVKLWEKETIQAHTSCGYAEVWRRGPDRYDYAEELPHLHESLDLQEKWVWPELVKIGYKQVTFDSDGYCWLNGKNQLGGRLAEEVSQEKTKPLAQLLAALRALGIT